MAMVPAPLLCTGRSSFVQGYTLQYNKPYLSVEEQIKHLKERNMVFEDEAAAAKIIQHIGYFRLSAYWFI